MSRNEFPSGEVFLKDFVVEVMFFNFDLEFVPDFWVR